MIVVIGSPVATTRDGVVVAAGMASRIALAAAGAGRPVQVVGKTGDDPTAEGVILDLSRGGVGHVALLRDPARATPLETPPADDEPPDVGVGDPPISPAMTARPAAGPALEAADVDLGLRYLTDFSVVVLAEPVEPDTVAIVAEAARWASATMILVLGTGAPVPEALPADVVVFEAPDADPDGVFADLVGVFAAALDDGAEPAAAFRASIATDGWTDAADD